MAAVVVVIVLLLVLNSPARQADLGPVVQRPSGPTLPPSVAPTTPPPPTSASPTPTPTVTVPVQQPPATQRPRVEPVAVTVLNNSRRTGLAHRAADQLRAAGWPIRRIGNFRGRLPESTLYYLPGQQRVARLLAHRFPGVRRVLPRFDGLPGHGLTLVVTREWPA